MRNIWFLIICFALSIASANSQDFRTVGYIPHYRVHLIDSFAFDKLTHVNVAFANPDAVGNLSFGSTDVSPIISRAHEHGAEVFISLAGGALTSAWAAAWKSLIKTENRDVFIQKIIAYALANDFDGIDMDLEWSHVDENYSGFVLALKLAANLHDLPLTAALPGTYRYPDISAEALAAFDWINMMVYDLRGPWDPDNVGPHSPISFAYSSINYWDGQGVEKDRLTLGMPFYGYDFTDQSNVHALTYAQIVNMDPANAYLDQVGDIYYNGIPTIETKTQLAIDDQLSGVMIWELGHDKFNEYSLLDKIGEVVAMNISSVNELDLINLNIYPNPFNNVVNVEFSEALSGYAQIRDMNGQVVVQKMLTGDSQNFKMQTNPMPAGIYFISVITDGQIVTKKLIK